MSCSAPFKALVPSFLKSKKRTNEASGSLNRSSSSGGEMPHSDVPYVDTCACVGAEMFCDDVDKWQQTVLDDKPPKYDDALYFYSDYLDTINEKMTEIDSELRDLSLKIHAHPELGFEEKYAHKTLSNFMEAHGFEVTRHYHLETAWKATFEHKSGGRVLGFNSEMDALPGIGHACGHNLIAIAGVGGAIATAHALKKHGIPGRVVLLGTPAEEGGNGKIALINAGAYKEMDACLMCHPSPGPKGSGGTGPSLAIASMTAEYFGHTAHAAGAPWDGQNSLDAAFVAYSALSALRQQIKPTHRIHGIIEGRNWAPNVIPDYAKLRWLVRAPTGAEVKALIPRIRACFEAAALATGTRLELKTSDVTLDLRQNLSLARDLAQVANTEFNMKFAVGVAGAVGGSTDFGNVTYELPSLHPSYAIPTVPNGGNHTALFTKAAATPEAHEATIKVTKSLALIGLRVLADDKFAARVKKDFKDGKTSSGPSEY